jgi:hypothetical protein
MKKEDYNPHTQLIPQSEKKELVGSANANLLAYLRLRYWVEPVTNSIRVKGIKTRW